MVNDGHGRSSRPFSQPTHVEDRSFGKPNRQRSWAGNVSLSTALAGNSELVRNICVEENASTITRSNEVNLRLAASENENQLTDFTVLRDEITALRMQVQ